MKNDIVAQKGVCLANSSYLRDYFALHNVEIHLETTLMEVKDNGVIVKDNEGNNFEINADNVILAIGYKPNPLSTKAKLVGDCKKVGNLRSTIWSAWDVAVRV